MRNAERPRGMGWSSLLLGQAISPQGGVRRGRFTDRSMPSIGAPPPLRARDSVSPSQTAFGTGRAIARWKRATNQLESSRAHTTPGRQPQTLTGRLGARRRCEATSHTAKRESRHSSIASLTSRRSAEFNPALFNGGCDTFDVQVIAHPRIIIGRSHIPRVGASETLLEVPHVRLRP